MMELQMRRVTQVRRETCISYVMRICHIQGAQQSGTIQQTMASDRVKSLEKTLTWLNLETITAFKKGRRIKEERRKKGRGRRIEKSQKRGFI